MKLSLERIARLTGAEIVGVENLLAAEAVGYSIDSRTIRRDELFFAVRGEKRDGHEFVPAALGAGAVAAVAARGLLHSASRLLLVPDPQVALEQLAARVRQEWGGRVVSITGSNGKTTTKEIIAALLATRFHVAKTEGNLNNQLGLPLSLLRMEEGAEVGVFEMGMNHRGEIRALAGIARPEIGVVTNVSAAHLEHFGSVEEIALAKRELIEGLPADGIAVLNADDERVRAFVDFHRERAPGGHAVTFGIEQPADIRAVEMEDLGPAGTRFRLEAERVEFTTPLVGRHNLYNTLAGLAVGRVFGIPLDALREAVASLAPASMRGEMMEVGGIWIINDCYNSNPRAAEIMLELLAATPGYWRVAVLGEMLELGAGSEDLHRQVGRKAARANLGMLVGVSGAARFIVAEAVNAGFPDRAAHFFENSRAAGEFLRTALKAGGVVLFKGSRRVRLEEALEMVVAAMRPVC
ncbi:MAG: UDP-N-acetylmuramoyl-tripeptide--D-alanyl-D-alanine ligase [Acidobacteria bacterium]|nr:UDP-N-acetylmuramoyl-tripeptide--D-alanyl-D-alanine ligase [Acidobacteriota bacterium]